MAKARGKTKKPVDKHARAEKIRQKLKFAFADRHETARAEAVAAFKETGVPDLFSDADLILDELASVRRYTLNGCPDGIPKLRPFSVSLVKRMLTSAAFFTYDAWALNVKMTDDEVLKYGDFRDEDAYLVNFCFDHGNGSVVECRREHVAQRKVLRALSDYVRTSAAYAKEIGAKKSAETWLRAFDIVLRYEPKETRIPYSGEEMDQVFAYIAEAASELYVAWMYPQLPTLEQLRKEAEA